MVPRWRRNDVAGIADDKDLTRAKPGDQVRNDTGIGAGDDKITRALAMSQNQEKVLVLLELVLLKRSDALDDLPHELSPHRAGGIACVMAPADLLAAAQRASRNLVDLGLSITDLRVSRDQAPPDARTSSRSGGRLELESESNQATGKLRMTALAISM